jgi:hypothetical protein
MDTEQDGTGQGFGLVPSRGGLVLYLCTSGGLRINILGRRLLLRPWSLFTASLTIGNEPSLGQCCKYKIEPVIRAPAFLST